MQQPANMHASSTTNSEEGKRIETEHLCSSTPSCNAEDGWSDSLSLCALNNADENWSNDNAQAAISDSECSDVDLDNGWVEREGCDSESSVDSIESRKKNKWLRCFFEMLKEVAINPTGEGMQDRLFYCPACRGSGLGEVSVYKGFKPLIAHAKQYTKRRVKLHRDFAAILEEDLKRCGIIAAEPCRANPFFEQISLIEDDKLTRPPIVWPPIVLMQSMGAEVDGHHKRVGLRGREILEMFKEYHPRKVKQVYDHTGDGGFLHLLVFRDSPVGYMQAKRLAQNFKLSKRGRADWDDLGVLKLQPCSDGMLYGYMAKEQDLLMLNTSDARKQKVKWDLKRYRDVVVEPLIRMHEAELENNWLKAKLQEQEVHNKELEKVLSKLYAKLELEEEEVEFTRQIARRNNLKQQ